MEKRGVGWPSGIGWGDNVHSAVGSSPAPHREGGNVTVMLRGVLIGWFDPGWQVFHLGVCISFSSNLPLVKQAAECGSYAKGGHTCITPI